MWVSPAKCVGSCRTQIRCLDWQSSSDGKGGWLATACDEGDVGISWINSRGPSQSGNDAPSTTAPGANLAYTYEACMYKSHFILKGHDAEVHLVRWKPSGDRLASYDSGGRIIAWTSRANVLASDFQITTPINVTDMQWSPCGYYLFICGKEGLIQIISGVNGFNLLSLQVQAIYPLSSQPSFTSCAWNQPGTRIAMGTRSGDMIVLDPRDNSASLSTMPIWRGVPIQSVQWYGPVTPCQMRHGGTYESQSLSGLLKNGDVVLFENLANRGYFTTETGVCDGFAAWNSSNTLLAVVGYKRDLSSPMVRFLNPRGYVIYTIQDHITALPLLPRAEASLHSISWGLDDSVLFIAQDSNLYSMEVKQSLPSLHFLCQRAITDELMRDSGREELLWLPLPVSEIKTLQSLKSPLIPAPFQAGRLQHLESLFKPLPANQRLHCILEKSQNLPGYTLEYEHLNGYVPLLQARRKPRRAGKLLTNRFIIEPAFNCTQQRQETVASSTSSPILDGKFWANRVSPRESPSHLPLPPSRDTISPSVLTKIRSALRPTHRQGIMDVSQQRAAVQSPQANLDHTLPALAEVEGNRVTKRYNFSTDSPLFQDGSLGNLNIVTSYIRLKPRRLSIILPDDSEGVLRSKEPVWNQVYQLYELDFGGRVNHDSTKNFQVERHGEVVLQFGRTHGDRFCLDFQAPFSPVQALCIAVACLH